MLGHEVLRGVLIGFLVLALLVGCASGKYVPRADEELYGTWVNEETKNRDQIQKQVHEAGGWKEYAKVSSTRPVDEGTSRIDKKWTDGQGNIWYAVFSSQTTGPAAGNDFQVLYRISKSATVLEYVWKASPQSDTITYPSTIDPASDSYHVFYRLKE